MATGILDVGREEKKESIEKRQEPVKAKDRKARNQGGGRKRKREKNQEGGSVRM